eukprot:7354730-Pyramimonas_sp.AAC.1
MPPPRVWAAYECALCASGPGGTPTWQRIGPNHTLAVIATATFGNPPDCCASPNITLGAP